MSRAICAFLVLIPLSAGAQEIDCDELKAEIAALKAELAAAKVTLNKATVAFLKAEKKAKAVKNKPVQKQKLKDKARDKLKVLRAAAKTVGKTGKALKDKLAKYKKECEEEKPKEKAT